MKRSKKTGPKSAGDSIEKLSNTPKRRTKPSKRDHPNDEHGDYTGYANRYEYGFTYNNWTPEGEIILQNFIKERCKYGCYGKELAPTTGTPHLQGYFNLNTKARPSAIHNQLKYKGVLLALKWKDKGDEVNLNYCSKDRLDFEHGSLTISGQGKRTELIAVAERVKSNTKINDIAKEFPVEYIKFHRGIKELKRCYDEDSVPEFRNVYTKVIWGHGGTGKTYTSIEEAKSHGDYYIVLNPNGTNQWWDGYNGEKSIIIDDFYGWIKPHDLYRILDKYKYQVPIKGGYVYARWEYVYITSNLPPSQWYKSEIYDKLDKHAYNRRLHEIWNYRYDEDHELIKECDKKPEPPTETQADLGTNITNDSSPEKDSSVYVQDV